MTAAPWNMACHSLLLWLSRERWSLRGECSGKALDALLDHGLAKVLFVGKHADGSSDGITLTAMGWAQVARIQERHRWTQSSFEVANEHKHT